jgi:hypothetical protein
MRSHQAVTIVSIRTSSAPAAQARSNTHLEEMTNEKKKRKKKNDHDNEK